MAGGEHGSAEVKENDEDDEHGEDEDGDDGDVSPSEEDVADEDGCRRRLITQAGLNKGADRPGPPCQPRSSFCLAKVANTTAAMYAG